MESVIRGEHVKATVKMRYRILIELSGYGHEQWCKNLAKSMTRRISILPRVTPERRSQKLAKEDRTSGTMSQTTTAVCCIDM